MKFQKGARRERKAREGIETEKESEKESGSRASVGNLNWGAPYLRAFVRRFRIPNSVEVTDRRIRRIPKRMRAEAGKLRRGDADIPPIFAAGAPAPEKWAGT